MKDFLGNELKIGDKIVVSLDGCYDERCSLELSEVVNFSKDRWGEDVVIFHFNNWYPFEIYTSQIMKL